MELFTGFAGDLGGVPGVLEAVLALQRGEGWYGEGGRQEGGEMVRGGEEREKGQQKRSHFSSIGTVSRRVIESYK